MNSLPNFHEIIAAYFEMSEKVVVLTAQMDGAAYKYFVEKDTSYFEELLSLSRLFESASNEVIRLKTLCEGYDIDLGDCTARKDEGSAWLS